MLIIFTVVVSQTCSKHST